MGTLWSHPPTPSYQYDALQSTGSFTLANGTSASYSSNVLTIVSEGKPQYVMLRMDPNDFTRLYVTLEKGKSVADALAVVCRGYY